MRRRDATAGVLAVMILAGCGPPVGDATQNVTQHDAVETRIATLKARADSGSELRVATAAWEMLAVADSLARFDAEWAGRLALDVYLSSAPRDARRLALSSLIEWDLPAAEPWLRLICEGRQDQEFQPLLGWVFITPRPWTDGRQVPLPDRSLWPPLRNVGWLEGRWRQVPETDDGVMVEEEWLPAANGAMRGVRLARRDGDLVAAVSMTLTAAGDDLVYTESSDTHAGEYRTKSVGYGVLGFSRSGSGGRGNVTYIQDADTRMIVHRTTGDRPTEGDIRRYRRLVFPHER